MTLRTPGEAVDYAMTRLTSGYNGLCLAHVQDAYGAVPVEPSAISAWTNSRHKHQTSDLASAPYGAPVYWSQPGNPYGHIALHLDGDRMYTTDSGAGHPHEASMSDWQNRYGYRPLGWTGDIEGQPIPGLAATNQTQAQAPTKGPIMAELLIIDDNTKDVWYWNNLVGRRKLGNTDQMHIYEVAGVKSIHSSNKANWMSVADGQDLHTSQAGSAILTDIRTTLAAQAAAIEALSQSMGADPEQIAQAVQQAVKDKLDSLEITITATDGTDQ